MYETSKLFVKALERAVTNADCGEPLSTIDNLVLEAVCIIDTIEEQLEETQASLHAHKVKLGSMQLQLRDLTHWKEFVEYNSKDAALYADLALEEWKKEKSS